MGALNTKMTALADAIRSKTGQTEKLSLDAMTTAVNDIEVGTQLPELTNEGVAADLTLGKELIDSQGNVVVGTNSNNPAEIASIAEEQAELITQARTSLAGKVAGVEPLMQNKTITENGTYTADDGYDGLGTVVVDTPIGEAREVIKKMVGSMGGFSLPVDYLQDIKTIRNYAFYKSSLMSIIIPDNVTSIGQSAFEDCNILDRVTLSNNITAIEKYTFKHCYSLTTVTIPDNVVSIDAEAFFGNTGLSKVVIGSGVTSIGDSAFESCSNLQDITVGDHITSVGYRAFFGTDYHKDSSNWDNGVLYLDKYVLDAEDTLSGGIVLKDGTRVLADSTFNGVAITSITMPDSLITIGRAALQYSDLTNVTIPANVEYIGASAFAENDALITVKICSITPPSLGFSAFGECSNLSQIIVPTGSADAYKSATNWSEYADLIVEETA